MEYKGVKVIKAKNREAWRKWLKDNHDKIDAIWLLIYKKESSIESVYYNEAVDEALCFGWIDSKPNQRDHESYYQYFSKRNPKSNWSKVNKEKIKRLLENNLMSERGLEMVALAKSSGTWDALNDVDNLIVPDDMMEKFKLNKKAFEFWNNFPPSTRRGILEWIFNAKRAATREKRIDTTINMATENKRANQYK